MPFSSYGTPATPYAYLGLGRTNNYVENLFVGSTRHQPQHYINIEGVLPNSQIVISPFQPAGALVPATWRRELYIHPGDWIPSVMATLTAAILVLALTVLVLHLNEKVRQKAFARLQCADTAAGQREDDLERRRKAHTINFDAL